MNDTGSLFDAVMGAAAPSSASLFDAVMSSPPAGQGGLSDAVVGAADGPLSAFRAKLIDPKEYERIKKWAGYLGTTPEDPIVARRLTNPLNFPSYSTLYQLMTTGNPDEVNDLTPEGNVAGSGLKAALTQFGHAGGIFRRRNDALIDRIAAGQELELGGTRDIPAQTPINMAGIPRPNLRIFKKLEDMTRKEQDVTVPKEIIDLVNQYDTPEAPLDARTRAEAIYTAAKSSATARAQTMEMAALELALREELTGKTGGFLERAGVLAAKGLPTVGYGNTFLVGGALGGGIAGAAGLTAAGVKTAAMIGSGVLGGLVAGVDKTSELLTADINPDTGEVDKEGTDYDDARLRGYGYGAREAATEIATSKVLGVAFKLLDKVTGGYMGKAVSKGADGVARQMAKTPIGRGVAALAKGIQRIAGLSMLDHPGVEYLEEAIQQWDDAVFAQRPSDTETPVYVKNVFNEATGEMEQVRVEPGSDEERTAKHMLARYGEKSGYAEAGTRQMTVGEKTKEFAWGDGVNKGFVSWENMTALAEGFALQYALTLGGGAMHAVKSKEARGIVDKSLLAAGFTNADLIRMSDEQKAEAFDAFYGAEANRDKFAEVFKDAGEMLSLSAQRVVDSELFMRTGEGIKPNFKTDIAKGVEGGAATLDDEQSGFSVDYTSTLEGTAFTVRDRDGVLSPATFNTAEEAQKGAEKMSQTKQGRQMHMEKRAEVATRVAQVFAPGRNVVLVQSDKDMKAAVVAEGGDPAHYSFDVPGVTTPNGTIVLNVAAITSFDHLVYVVKHETGHSVGDEAGLTKLMAGKTVNWIAAEFQKAGIIAPGKNEREKFVKAVESVRAQYAARGVKLTDADAVGEVLSMLQEGMTPLFRKRFGDGLVTLLRGKDKSAKNMRDVRRAVALIMYSGREAKVDLYGGPDAWKAPAPAFTGDPIAAAGGEMAETGEKGAVEPAEEAAPEAMPAQGEEAPGAETVPPVAAPEAKPPAAPSPEAEAAAKDIKAAFEAKQKAKAPVGEAAPVETPPEAPKVGVLKFEFPAPATPVAKMTFPSEEAMLEYVAAHPEETANWTEENFEIVPAPAPAKSDGAPIVPTSEAGRGEAEPEPAERPGLHSLAWFIGTGMSPEAAQKAYEGERGQGKTETVPPKPAYLTLGDTAFSKAMMGESMGGNAGPNRIAVNFLHDGSGVVFWGNFQESSPAIRKRYDAGELKDGTLLLEFNKGDFAHPKVVDALGDLPSSLINVKGTAIDLTRPTAPKSTVNLEGGTPAEIEAEKAKVEAQRKKQEERDEIAKKAAAPLKGGLGDSTPPLPGMEGVAPDDLELLNQKPKEAQNADQERGAEEVAGGEQAGSAEKDGGGDAQGSEAAGTGGKPEGEGLQKRAVEIAEKNAEVEFHRVPRQGSGRFKRGAEYVEIPGVSVGGKRTYLRQSTRGNAKVFYVSRDHYGKVLNGMAALMRVKGASETVSAVRIIGGGKAPEGSEKWGVSEWATHNQKLSNQHKEEAKPAVPTASDSAPTAEAKPVEAPKTEAPKAEPPAPAPKMKFASEEEMMRYVSLHPELNWTGDEFEIVPDEKGEAAPVAPQAEQEAAPAVAQFEPPKIKYGENTGAYRRRVAAAKAEWDKEQAAKADADKVSPEPRQSIDKAEPEGPVFDADYTGPRFTYGMRNRPLQIGAQPKGFIIGSLRDSDKFKFGTIQYPRQLTDKEVYDFELVPVADAKDTEEIAELQANAETQARVRAIPDAEYAAAPALAVMDVELPAYEARKAAATRTADSKERQAYSTPPPLAAIGAAALASARGDNADAVTVIEPTAGNGGLIAVLGISEGDKILANELDEGRAKRLGEVFLDATVTQGDYAAEAYQQSVRDAAKDGPRAFLMNPPFGPTDESGYKLEHNIALKTIESAVPGDTLFFIGAAPGRNAMKMPTGALAGVYTAGAFAKFHQELNRRGWKATLHFIADGALYRKMGASFPVEVLLMEKTDGSEMNPHMPMRDLPARYSTWEQIRAAVAEMYDPGAETLGERVANDLDLSGKAEQARAEAQGNAEASSAEVNAARVKEGAAGTLRFRLSQDIELGLVTPETGLTLNPFMMKINGKVWDKEFAGKVHNPDQLARYILSLPAEIAEARIKVADAIAKHLAANPANGFVTGTGFNSMGPALREAFEARWNAARTTDMDAEEDKGQIEYAPLSAVKVASPMKMPRELAGGMAAALSSFDERHPEGVDTFVAEKMRRPMTEKELDGSQIDTLGLALEKIDEGTGFIVGSMTGAGKGRVMGSVMDYHILNGRVPIFLTAQPKLFTDIWRDITAIGAQDRFKPLVMNDYKTPKNEDPDSEDVDAFSMPVFFTPVQRNSALSEGKLPQGANAIFLTYSQVQNPTANTRLKIDLIKKLLVSGKGALVMDEAHLAAGADSNRGAVLREFADLAKPGVVFSSATFAKRGENMTLYKRAGYSQFFKNDEDMEKALMVGGVPFQQYLAARLTERGFYVRHELDYENVIFKKLTTIDTLGTPQERTTLAQHEEQIADVFNQVVRAVIRFGGMVKAVNSRLQKGAPGANMDGAAFMSSLHNTASFIYTALKAETVANAAVAELRAGRAPVVTLYNTNQALLTEIGLNQSADVGRYLTRISERAVSIQMPDGSSASILTPAGFGELVRLVKIQEATMLRDAADTLVREARSAADYLREQNLPASPIDRVREIVENAGYQFGEVTGRTLMVQNGVVVRRIKPNPDTVIRQFNQGAPDGSPNMVLLLNSSGSTGLSAHASRDFRNQARRVMFVLQPAWDINEMMQMFGRVNRKNQLSKPIYHLVFTSAAGEQRNAAILMSKLRSLAANTSGVSKAGYGEAVEDALDFMNAFGNKALAELVAERNPVVAAINALRASKTIREATSISQFLPVREQEEFISQIQAKVAALQDNAREAGLHDLEAGDIGRVPLTVEQLMSDSAMRAYEVPVLGRGKILTASEAVAAGQAWQAKHPTMLDDAKAKIDKAIAGTSNPWLKRIYGDTAQVLERALDSIGQVYYVRDDVGGGRCWFVPIEARLPPSGTAQTASDWRIKVSFNTIRGVTTIPLSIFSDKILSNAAKSSERNYNETLTRKEDRTIIAGDVAQALIGNIVATGASGASQIVRALPVDGNFSSFVLMMPRGITVANAKKIASSRLEKVTDVMDIRVGQNGYLGIDADRVKVTPTYSSTTGDQIGAVFAFRIATPIKSKSKKITVAQIMRAAGAESRLRDTPNSRGYVIGPYLGVDESNTALKNLATLHPALQATQIVSDEAKVGGQDAVARNAPRFKLAGVKLDAAAEPVFFSQLRRTLEAKMPNRMTVMALRSMINPAKGSGIKADEIEWTGLKDFLDGKNPGDYVTKAEALEAVRDVEIQEVVKDDRPAQLTQTQTEILDAVADDPAKWESVVSSIPYTSLTRTQRREWVEENRNAVINIMTREKPDRNSSTKFSQYQLAGGENYRELLLTLPTSPIVAPLFSDWMKEKGYPISERDKRVSEYQKEHPPKEKTEYRSSHFSEPNILAHVRFNERQAANGDNTLFLEEVQSDWMQEGRDKGFAKDTTGWTARLLSAPDAGFNHWQINDAKGNEVTKIVGGTKEAAISKAAEGVPDAPFKDTSKGWARLAFKRMLRWGAENGFDRVAWTTGEMQAERYDLSKQVSRIEVYGSANRTYNVFADDMSGKRAIEKHDVPESELAGVIGKELAQKVVASPMPRNEFTGLDLKVGGEGMRTFYDQILPSIANDIGKKFGAKVEDTVVKAPEDNEVIWTEDSDGVQTVEWGGKSRKFTDEAEAKEFVAGLREGKTIVHSLPVTPAMRDSVMQGQPRFKLPGVTLDGGISAPVRVGELRTQTQLEKDDPVGFPILDHIRGGSRIIIPPPGAIGGKSEYEWFTSIGGLKAFNLAERKAFFQCPKAALGENKSHGNIDTLAKELEEQLGTDDVETFVNAFLAEVDRSRALYSEQKERQVVRRAALETFSESPYLAGMKDIGENLGKAVGSVFDSLHQGEEKATLEMIWEREGTDAVRDYILREHIDLVAINMIERHALQMEVESGARDEAPPIIQDRGTLAIDTPVNEKGDTRFVFDQTKESLDVKRARLYAQALQGVPTITDEAAAAHVRELLDAGGKVFLRDIAQKLTAERLIGATTRPLDKLQTAIMLWYQTDLDERAKDSDRQAQAAVEAHDLNNLNAVDMMRDSLNRETIDYLNAARQYGSLAGQALQALKLRVDHAFDIVKIYRQAREDIGRDLTRAEFEKLKARVGILEKKWNDYVDAATLPDGEAELDARVVELEKKLADVTAARAAVKTEVDRLGAKKAALEAEYAKQSGEATAFSEKKAQLEAQIAGLENEIALRVALNQQVEELQGKVDALQAKLDALDAEYAGASPELLASLEKQLADLTKLHAEKLAAYQKADEELKTANERLKRVRKLIEKLGKGTKAKIARRRAVIENAANLYKEFKAEMERAQVEQLKTRWRSSPLPKKALMAFEGVENIIQGLQSMADESVVGRQLIKIGRGHPILWGRAFAQSQHIVFHRSGMTDDTGRTLTWQERSDRYYYELDQAQREDPLFDILVRKGGLDWMDITADPTSFDEQQIPIGPLLNNMFPSKATRFTTSVLGVSNNHYAGMSNMLRFAVAKQLYNQMSVAKGETPNEDDIYAIVSTVDIFGARGDTSTQTARAVLDFGRHLLYSPRLALANAQYYRRMFGMLANPRYSRQARKMILMEYVRSGIGYATLSFIARVLSWLLYDDKDQQRFQFRSGHTAYTQFMFGQQRVDITGGQATWDRAAMNFLGGGLIDLLPEWARDVISVIDNGDKLAAETGLVITEQYTREKGDYAALGRFARSKLKPLTGMFLDLARGKNYEGQAAGPRAQPHQPGYDRRYLNLLRSIAPVPLSLQTAGELYMGDPDQGINPVRDPFLFVNWMTMESLGMLARSLPINAELAQQVAEGYTKNAEELESLKRKQRDIMSDRKMSPEMKELKAGRIQDKLDRLRGM